MSAAPVDVLAVMDAEIVSLPTMAEMASRGVVSCDATDAIAQMTEARAAVAELIAEREKFMSLLARPAHLHLEGAHLGADEPGCVLCEAIKAHAQTRAALARCTGEGA